MPQFDSERAKRLLRAFDFVPLFIEELGWDHFSASHEVVVADQPFQLSGIAEKRGVVVFRCRPLPDGSIPKYPLRLKIDRAVAKSYHQHFIIFCDENEETQIWQWIKREAGRPAARHHTYHRTQSGESLVQKLRQIAVAIDEEADFTHVDATSRTRAAFDVERVTRRFYDVFKKEHDAFLKFLDGIPDEEMERWYVSVMLNRLMFIYFIQRKGFLNGDTNYLKTQLHASKARGTDEYYRAFLCPLFFEGFAKKESYRSPETNRLLGRVPYLNGGLFLRHEIEERHGEKIEIPDAAFERLFAFFDQYQWHLDERPLRDDREINPDVLGYIFEKYINQKQMGAYYTKEDITEYISKNTVIPYLFDVARKECRIAFEGDHTIWQLPQADPDRYIYDAVKKGVELPLPEEIAVGLNDVAQRTEWNKTAPPEYALPTEIWREVVARRKRYEEVRGVMERGEIASINDFITYNLNIRQFAQDVIENCEGPELLRAFYHAIEKVTILDPTCGSGAFLFAALNILEPLYEACLDRMEDFIAELERSGEKHRPEKYGDFRKILERVAQHPNRRYFILKSIVLNNLYGVDIMEEAVEICKLRLFLKLVAQVERVEDIEPLPDIDFNIRAGNTLVGYATEADVKRAFEGRLDFDNAFARIAKKADEIADLFWLFREQQTEYGGDIAPEDKAELRSRLAALEDELNRALASEYRIDAKNANAYRTWLASHKPFHWFIEFYGIMKEGGFDAVIGNPPYLEERQIDYRVVGLDTWGTSAVHAMCVEQSRKLLRSTGCMSMIVPMSVVSTQRMEIAQNVLENEASVWYSNYSWRPGKLFETVNRALTIFVLVTTTRKDEAKTYTTTYRKWTSDTRDPLMTTLAYAQSPRNRSACWVPKLGEAIEQSILDRCLKVSSVFGRLISTSRTGIHRVYYRTTGGLYWKVFTDFPPAFRINGRDGHSSRETSLVLLYAEFVHPAIAALSSGIFWWWYCTTSNCRDVNPYDIQNFPIPDSALKDHRLKALGTEYVEDLKRNSEMRARVQKQTGRTETQAFKVQKSKPIIDEIDRALAEHYGFTDEELDFISNYDIKYRVGADDGSDEGDDG